MTPTPTPILSLHFSSRCLPFHNFNHKILTLLTQGPTVHSIKLLLSYVVLCYTFASINILLLHAHFILLCRYNMSFHILQRVNDCSHATAHPL